jgi:hypothetical protein
MLSVPVMIKEFTFACRIIYFPSTVLILCCGSFLYFLERCLQKPSLISSILLSVGVDTLIKDTLNNLLLNLNVHSLLLNLFPLPPLYRII